MSNIFGVYEADLKGVVLTDENGCIHEAARVDENGQVEAVATVDSSGNVEAVWTDNIFGGSSEYTPDGELVSFSVPDENLNGVEHVFDAEGELAAITLEEEPIDDGNLDDMGGDSLFDSISLDDFV